MSLRAIPPARRASPFVSGLAWIGLAGVATACEGSDRNVDPVLSPAVESVPSVESVFVAKEEPPPTSTPSPALPDLTDPSWNRVTSRAGTYLVLWRSPAGAVPRNQDFELEVWILRDGAPVKGATLDVSAWMPDHGHGMLRRSRPLPQPDGSFRVEGMLLHMRGHWQVFFEVLEGTLAETAESAVDL